MSRRKARAPRKRKRFDRFLGFTIKGRPEPRGRRLDVPRTLLTAQGGGVAYDDNAEWAEGEPGEMRS